MGGRGEGNWLADVDVDVDTSKIFVTSVFSLLPPMPTSTSTSIQGIVFYFLTFSYAFYADVEVDVDSMQGFIQYFMHKTNARRRRLRV